MAGKRKCLRSGQMDTPVSPEVLIHETASHA